MYIRIYKINILFQGKNMANHKFNISQLLTTIVPYANSLDPDETPSNSTSHPDPSCLTLRHFHQL